MITGETALSIIKKTVFKTLGCTDPVAIALAAATAYKQVGGEIKSVSISMDKNYIKMECMLGYREPTERASNTLLLWDLWGEILKKVYYFLMMSVIKISRGGRTSLIKT